MVLVGDPKQVYTLKENESYIITKILARPRRPDKQDEH